MGNVLLDEKFIVYAHELVKNAEKEICLCSFKIEINEKPLGRSLKGFFDTLAEKAALGIKVKILFNWRPNERNVPRTNKTTALTLKAKGVQLKYLTNDRCCHAKILIVDRKKGIVGSHNLSVCSITSNFEISYTIPNNDEIAEVQRIFDDVFAAAKEI